MYPEINKWYKIFCFEFDELIFSFFNTTGVTKSTVLLHLGGKSHFHSSKGEDSD